MRQLIVLNNCPPKFVLTLHQRVKDTGVSSELLCPAQYFVHQDKSIQFDPHEIPDAEDWCLEHAETILSNHLVHTLIIDNCYRSGPEAYLNLATSFGYQTKVHEGAFHRDAQFV